MKKRPGRIPSDAVVAMRYGLKHNKESFINAQSSAPSAGIFRGRQPSAHSLAVQQHIESMFH